MSSPLREFPFVDDAANLQEVVRHVANAKLIALDTEFVRERTYYPQLCVLQIATADMIAAIDCLADIDLGALFDCLARPDTSWILHSARQDLEVLMPRTGRRPARLIDTQVAAAMLGFGLQVGLQGLLSETLGIAIGKEHTRIDWSRRPLAREAINYALDDVRYLMPVWNELAGRLEARGRTHWASEDCARLLNLPVEPAADTILDRTKGVGALSGRQRAAALALVTWREERARRSDKPRRWILADDQLVRIARALPENGEALKKIDSLPKSFVARSGDAVLAAIRNAEPAADAPAPAAPDKQILRSLQDRIRALAEDLGVQPELLATRRDLSQVAAGQLPDGIASGWRGEVLAGAIGEFSRAPAS